MSETTIIKRKFKAKKIIGNDILSQFDYAVLSNVFEISRKGMQVGDVLFSVLVNDGHYLFASICPTEYRKHEQAELAKALWISQLAENPSDSDTLDINDILSFSHSNVPVLVGTSKDGINYSFLHGDTLRIHGMGYNSNKLEHFSITPTELTQAIA